MLDICCIGHITLDKVVTPRLEVFMPGGTSFYFSNAIRKMNLNYQLITCLAEGEMQFVKDLQMKGIAVLAYTCPHTVYFENIYPENQDHRIQNVLQTANPFSPEQFREINAEIFHLGPLLAEDIPESVILYLATKGKLSLDVQGYLRSVHDHKVFPVDWEKKQEILPHIHYLKANETEMEKLTGQQDVYAGARLLSDWGVNEVIITLGSKGSVIYQGGEFYPVPAYLPEKVVDATGCGDTYMAGYLSQRRQGASITKAGNFGAAMATLKIQSSGPFTGSPEQVYNRMKAGIDVSVVQP
ncbi:MAG: ribokinase [Bacteroidota bacterium]|nr:ribokinase [Bacteroidota bacterium]